MNTKNLELPINVSLVFNFSIILSFFNASPVISSIYKNKKIAVYRGTDCIYSRKRPVLAPGEMETVRLKAELLRGPGDAVTVTLEEG